MTLNFVATLPNYTLHASQEGIPNPKHKTMSMSKSNNNPTCRTKTKLQPLPFVPFRTTILLLTYYLLCTVFATKSNSSTRDLQDTLLKLSKTFAHPPHTTELYDTLQVLPNATSIEITKQYRKLTRQYHPDKHGISSSDTNHADKKKKLSLKLDQVRLAYDVLSDDGARLLYHKYGLVQSSNNDDNNSCNNSNSKQSSSSSSHYACLLLTGSSGSSNCSINNNNVNNIEAQRQLMRLMGYDSQSPSMNRVHHQRILFIAADLVERIRPLVEGLISEEQVVHDIAAQCDLLKRLPLGAQIIRCIGRAYRHAGQRVLNKYQKLQQFQNGQPPILPVAAVVSSSIDLTDSFHQKVRSAKDIFTAAVASGKLVLSEKATKRRKQKISNDQQSTPSIDYYSNDVDYPLSDTENESIEALTGAELDQMELERMESAMLEALQIEALWKISKIELDRVIQEACGLIMNGKYFFFPSHQAYHRPIPRRQHLDGWVGGSGETVDADVGKARAAAALILIGDTLVRCSKEKTSWN